MVSSSELRQVFLALSIARSGSRRERRELLSKVAANEIESGVMLSQYDRLSGPEKLRAREIEEELAERGISFVCFIDVSYPPPLRAISDPPFGLFAIGNVESLSWKHTAALVGTRVPSSYGRDLAFEFASELTSRGVSIVSGFALGIDSSAHEGAIYAASRQSDTKRSAGVAVLGSGFMHIYPSQNRTLVDKFVDHGGVIFSEYAPDTTPERYHFPERNRIVSGLSRAVIVVEAAAKSGALITARLAAEQGRDVFAVPGPIGARESAGTLSLLGDGAQLVTGIETLLDYFSLSPVRVEKSADRKETLTSLLEEHHDSPKKCALLQCLSSSAVVAIDSLPHLTEMSMGEVLALLTELELNGTVIRGGNGTYSLANSTIR